MTHAATGGEPAESAPAPPDHRRQRRFGTFLIAAGVFGIIVSIVAAVGAIAFLALFEDDVDASSEVTEDAISAAQDSVVILRSVVDTLDGQTGGIAVALRDTADVVEQSRDVVDGSVTLTTEDVPEILDSLDEFVPTFENAAASVDSALSRLSDLPFGPDYEPDVTLEEAVAGFGPALADLSSTLRSSGAELAEANESLANSPDQLRDAAAAIEELDADLDRTTTLVDDYERTLDEAELVATDALDRVEGGADWAVPLVMALAVAFALTQAVPIWLGRRLRAGDDLVEPR